MTGRLVLLRHGQSYGNLECRLDTAPPGAGLTQLGRDQARAYAQRALRRPGLLAHSVATRAAETAAVIAAELGVDVCAVDGIHEVQAGKLENRDDDEAIAEFNAVYRRWHQGEPNVRMPGGENAQEVLDRYVPVLTELRLRYLDDDGWNSDIVVVSHGAAIRLVAGVVAGVDGGFALNHHLGNAQAVVLTPITDGRWSCTRWAELAPPFQPELNATLIPDSGQPSLDPMG
ncbi:MAG: phosphoglycerate mutase family protein [Mycobacteriaceae bacterium]|nr:phosphoglycerate mutase family protein [Mycobacteriaceae bacterium]